MHTAWARAYSTVCESKAQFYDCMISGLGKVSRLRRTWSTMQDSLMTERQAPVGLSSETHLACTALLSARVALLSTRMARRNAGVCSCTAQRHCAHR